MINNILCFVFWHAMWCRRHTACQRHVWPYAIAMGVLYIKNRTIQKITLHTPFNNWFLSEIPGEPVNRAKAYGRIAFSCPFDQQPEIDRKVQAVNGTILTPLISLDTPGKATVRVIILADPDGHEICFVDDESFRQLSQVDPASDADLDKFIKSDKSRAH